MESCVYFVTLLDINWPRFGPLYGPLNYSANAPSAADSLDSQKRLDTALQILSQAVDNHFVIAVHSGTCCRIMFYREPFISYWHRTIRQGGEIALHPHEEVVGLGALYGVKQYMRQMVMGRWSELLQEGIRPVGFQTANFAYSDLLTPLLEEIGIYIDLSCAPGMENMLWGAAWKGSPLSAFYLCSVDASHFGCSHPRSSVLEIPLGCDGRGTDMAENYLLNEMAPSLAALQGVWDAIVERSQREQRPQFVQFKCHLTGVDDAEMRTRLEGFLSYARAHDGTPVTPSRAKALYDDLATQ